MSIVWSFPYFFVFFEVGVQFKDEILIIDKLKYFFWSTVYVLDYTFWGNPWLDVEFKDFANFISFYFPVRYPAFILLILFHDGDVFGCNFDEVLVTHYIFHDDAN